MRSQEHIKLAHLLPLTLQIEAIMAEARYVFESDATGDWRRVTDYWRAVLLDFELLGDGRPFDLL